MTQKTHMTEEEKKAFTERLREKVFLSGKTQRQIAELCGITEVSLSRYLSGSRIPEAPILANLANVLHTTSDELLGKNNPFSDYAEIRVMIARGKKNFTEEQRRELSDILLGIQERKEHEQDGF